MWKEKLDGEILEQLGQDIRRLRKSRKMNQQQLAEQVGVSRKHISDVEAGRSGSLLTFVRILKVFNKVDALLQLMYTPRLSPKALFYKEHGHY